MAASTARRRATRTITRTDVPQEPGIRRALSLRQRRRSGYNVAMQIMLNGSPRDCANAITVAQLLQEAGYGDRRVAVEVNREIVPRSMHIRWVLAEGDQVEIVHAIGGG